MRPALASGWRLLSFICRPRAHRRRRTFLPTQTASAVVFRSMRHSTNVRPNRSRPGQCGRASRACVHRTAGCASPVPLSRRWLRASTRSSSRFHGAGRRRHAPRESPACAYATRSRSSVRAMARTRWWSGSPSDLAARFRGRPQRHGRPCSGLGWVQASLHSRLDYPVAATPLSI